MYCSAGAKSKETVSVGWWEYGELLTTVFAFPLKRFSHLVDELVLTLVEVLVEVVYAPEIEIGHRVRLHLGTTAAFSRAAIVKYSIHVSPSLLSIAHGNGRSGSRSRSRRSRRSLVKGRTIVRWTHDGERRTPGLLQIWEFS